MARNLSKELTICIRNGLKKSLTSKSWPGLSRGQIRSHMIILLDDIISKFPEKSPLSGNVVKMVLELACTKVKCSNRWNEPDFRWSERWCSRWSEEKNWSAMNRSILVSSETDLHESKEKWFLSVSRRFIPTLRNQTKKPTGAYYPKSKLMARSGQYYPTKKFTTNVVRFHDLVDTHPR